MCFFCHILSLFFTNPVSSVSLFILSSLFLYFPPPFLPFPIFFPYHILYDFYFFILPLLSFFLPSSCSYHVLCLFYLAFSFSYQVIPPLFSLPYCFSPLCILSLLFHILLSLSLWSHLLYSFLSYSVLFFLPFFQSIHCVYHLLIPFRCLCSRHSECFSSYFSCCSGDPGGSECGTNRDHTQQTG